MFAAVHSRRQKVSRPRRQSVTNQVTQAPYGVRVTASWQSHWLTIQQTIDSQPSGLTCPANNGWEVRPFRRGRMSRGLLSDRGPDSVMFPGDLTYRWAHVDSSNQGRVAVGLGRQIIVQLWFITPKGVRARARSRRDPFPCRTTTIHRSAETNRPAQTSTLEPVALVANRWTSPCLELGCTRSSRPRGTSTRWT